MNDRDGNGVCFLAVFRNELDDNWVFGTKFLERYYTVWDATSQPLKLGLGLRSKSLIIDQDADNKPYTPGDDDNDDYIRDNKGFFLTATLIFLIGLCVFALCCYYYRKDSNIKQENLMSDQSNSLNAVRED